MISSLPFPNFAKGSEKLEADSIQLFNFTSAIKKESLEVKTETIEHLWKIIISDESIDQYESSLMRRICGLINFKFFLLLGSQFFR